MPRLIIVKSSSAWVVYSVIRVGIFAVALAALLLLQVTSWIAAILAAVIALCISYIFFRGPRDKVSADIYARRTREARDVDNEIENEALDRIEAEKREHTE